MRKVKIFLTMMAVAGVLFATVSCVDNTESESVSALRNAKAQELLAQAKHLSDADAIARLSAEAEAELIRARIAMAEADAVYRRAEADVYKLQAKIDSLVAVDRNARDNATHEVEILRLEFELQRMSDIAAEDLRVAKANNDVIIAEQEANLVRAKNDVRLAIINTQIAYLEAVTGLDLASVDEYRRLVGLLTGELQNIAGLEADIEDLKLNIAKKELELATYSIDSARFVTKFIATAKAEITKDSISLKHSERRLALAETTDAGLEALGEAKLDAEKDTLDAGKALAEALAEIAVLEADTTVKGADMRALQPAYDAVLEDMEEAFALWDTALKNIDMFNNVTQATGANRRHVTTQNNNTGIFLYEPINIDASNRDDYPGGSFHYFDIGNYSVAVYVEWDYSDYVFDLYEIDTWSFRYSSVEDYENAIQGLKRDSLQKKNGYYNIGGFWIKGYDNLQTELNDSVERLKILGAEERTLYANLQDTLKTLDAAEKTEQEKNAAYQEALAAWNADPTPAKELARNVAQDAHTAAVTARDNARASHIRALNRYNEIHVQYDRTNNRVKTLVNGVISAKVAMDDANSTLAAAKENLAILKALEGTTLEQLVFAEHEARNKVSDLYESDAYTAYREAQETYLEAIEDYTDYVIVLKGVRDAYDMCIEELEWIEFQISTGGEQSDINYKADYIRDCQIMIANLQANLATKQLHLEDVARYAMDDDQGRAVAEAIKSYNIEIENCKKQIATKETEIEQVKERVPYYERAIETFVKELELLLGE
jgi:hypothetical protein